MLINFGGLLGGQDHDCPGNWLVSSAVYLRVDLIEQAIRDFRSISNPLDDAGYRIGYASRRTISASAGLWLRTLLIH